MLGTIVFVEQPRSKAEQAAFPGHACASLPTVGHRGSRIPTEVGFALANLPSGLTQLLSCELPPVHIALLRHVAA